MFRLSVEGTVIYVRNWLLSIWYAFIRRGANYYFYLFFGCGENHKIWFGLRKMHGATHQRSHTEITGTVFCVGYNWWDDFGSRFAFCSIYSISIQNAGETQIKRIFHLASWAPMSRGATQTIVYHSILSKTSSVQLMWYALCAIE